METKLEKFRDELQELLNKYNVTISFNVSACSDTHGIYKEKFVVVDKTNYKNSLDLTEEGCWGISPEDIKDIK